MNTYSLDTEMVRGVVQHMNEDHADACLAIVNASDDARTFQHATMQSIDPEGIDLQASAEDGTTHTVRIPFDKPISHDSQVRGHLVALAKRARDILNR